MFHALQSPSWFCEASNNETLTFGQNMQLTLRVKDCFDSGQGM